MPPGRQRLLSATKAEYRRLQRERAAQLAVLPSADLRNINVAQNVLRDVLTALLSEMAPCTHHTAVELSRRLASYHGRAATWLDAMAHCTPETQARWRTELISLGVDVDAGAVNPQKRERTRG